MHALSWSLHHIGPWTCDEETAEQDWKRTMPIRGSGELAQSCPTTAGRHVDETNELKCQIMQTSPMPADHVQSSSRLKSVDKVRGRHSGHAW